MTKTIKQILLDEAVKHLEQGAQLANRLSAMAVDLAPEDRPSTLEQAMSAREPKEIWEQEFRACAMDKKGNCGPLFRYLRLHVMGPWDANQKAADAWIKTIRQSNPIIPRGWTIALHALEAKKVETDR